jgi:hypothetical protein
MIGIVIDRLSSDLALRDSFNMSISTRPVLSTRLGFQSGPFFNVFRTGI